MANILKPDRTVNVNGVTVNEFLLTSHNSNNIDMPSDSMEDSILGVTIHNTNWITTAEGTTPAEQYTRVTFNGNMGDVRVHFYCDDVCAWQNLPLSLSGWHAADGDGDGNRRTIAIECIMSPEYNERDRKSEDNCARLAAALLNQYGLGIESLFTQKHWYSKKNCPAQILPHWDEFVKKVSGYLEALKPEPKPAQETKKLYRVRKSKDDAKSQIGAYSVLDNAKRACPPGYTVFDENGKTVHSVPERSYAKGTKIELKDVTLYASSTSEDGTKKSGTFYLYDGAEINGRMRITIKPEYCGNTPIGMYVTGWVNKADI